MSFGFSATELINAVNGTIKTIIALKQVPEQLLCLQQDLEVSKGQLEGLESVLQKCKNSIDARAAASFDRLQETLLKVLNDTSEFLKRYHPKDTSRSSVLSNFGRARWVVDATYLGTVKGIRERICQIERSIDREIHLLNLLYSSRHDNAAPVHYKEFVDGQRGLNVAAPCDNGSNASLRKETQVSSPSKYNACLDWPVPAPIGALPLSPPPSPTIRSLQRSQTGATATSQSSPIIPAPTMRRASTFTNTPPHTRETLPLTGIVKVWFYTGRKDIHQSYNIRSLTLLRDSSGQFCAIDITRSDGHVLKDEISKPWQNTTKHPMPVHHRETRDCIDSNKQITQNCIKFLHDTPSTSSPKFYSFSDIEDYRLFSNRIVGQKLLYWSEVKEILSAWSKTPLCENQVLQLWEIDGRKSIRFFRNGKEGVFSQHWVDFLQIEEDDKILLLKFLHTLGGRMNILTAEEKKMEYLEVVFTDPNELPIFSAKAGFVQREVKRARWKFKK
ncbi:hypothetical protein ACEPPN_011983 [Leptodophora sp. 'Broadleaf-Isolate-01']